jgi:hypothetical protein
LIFGSALEAPTVVAGLDDIAVLVIPDDALRLVLPFDGRGHDLVKGGLHAVEFELAHEIEELSSFHQLYQFPEIVTRLRIPNLA